MPRRQGLRQRIRARVAAGALPRDEGDHRPTHGDQSHLVDRVLELWAWGSLSAVTVQYIMEGAVKDGIDNPRAKALARVGTSGRWTQNCQRDITRQLMGETKVPPLYTFDVPAFDAKMPGDAKHINTTGYALLPHQVFAAIAEGYKNVLGSWTNERALEDFWAAALGTGDFFIKPEVVDGHV